jgi:hypothetical protein
LCSLFWFAGDAEEGKANSHDHEDHANMSKEEEISGEKSVLQAKLTRLAIQIGYAGEHLNFLLEFRNQIYKSFHKLFF